MIKVGESYIYLSGSDDGDSEALASHNAQKCRVTDEATTRSIKMSAFCRQTTIRQNSLLLTLIPPASVWMLKPSSLLAGFFYPNRVPWQPIRAYLWTSATGSGIRSQRARMRKTAPLASISI